MELTLELSTLLGLGIAALVAGFIDAIAGGGGLLVMPALLSTGMAPHWVLGTNKLIGTFGTLSAALTFIRKGLFQPSLWWLMSLATLLGALFGALLIFMISAGVLKKLLPLAILATAAYLVWPRRTLLPHNATPSPPQQPPGRPGIQLLTGGLIGFYDGFIGPGTGAFWTVAALRLFRLDLVAAAGVARFMNFISNAAALATFIILGNIDYALGLTMGSALMLGSVLGAHSAIRYGAPFIRPVFLCVVLGMAAWLLLAG